MTSLRAQEALRSSNAGAEAAERRKIAGTAYYNFKYGPVSLRFNGAFGVEGNDNVNLSQDNPRADLIVRPQLSTDASWVVTEKNTLHFGLGVGYAKYLKSSELDSFFITPGSDISFDIFAGGDVVINLHDRYSLGQEAYNQPTVSSTGNFGRFENVGGVIVNWDLNKMFVNFGYDHETYISTKSTQ